MQLCAFRSKRHLYLQITHFRNPSILLLALAGACSISSCLKQLAQTHFLPWYIFCRELSPFKDYWVLVRCLVASLGMLFFILLKFVTVLPISLNILLFGVLFLAMTFLAAATFLVGAAAFLTAATTFLAAVGFLAAGFVLTTVGALAALTTLAA